MAPPQLYPYYPPPELASPPARPRRRWYGWQTLPIDVVALVMLSRYSDHDGGTGWLAASMVTYFVGAPTVHAFHGHAGKALLSLGLRGASGGAVAWAVSSCDQGWGCLGPIVLSILSVPAAIAVDTAVIAREDVPDDDLAVWLTPWRSPTGAVGVGSGMRLRF